MLLAAPVAAHPLKMSVANLEYDAKSGEYLLDLRMFLDDYLVVTGVIDSEADFTRSLALMPQKAGVRKYLEEHFILYFNDHKVDMKVDKVEVEELTIYVKFKIKEDLGPTSIYSIKIIDSIFTEQFVNQRNVLHVNLPGKSRRSLLFNQFQPEGELSWGK